MFADKLQNPFLKPSPFTSSPYLPSYMPAYNASPPPSTYKFSSYKTYEQPSSLSYKTSTYEIPISYNLRQSQTKDIDTMLINNPFNRKTSTFGGSRTSDLSPNKYSYQAASYDKTKINNYENYQYTPQNYQNLSNNHKSYRDTQRVTPTKKYDNYLSTSSAESVATYINRITDLEEEKASVYDAKPLPENPFYRKNLLQKTTEAQKIPNKDYQSSAAIKYKSYRIESNRQVPAVKVDQNSYQTYIEDEYENRDLGYKNNYETTFSKDKNLGYQQQKSAKFGSKEDIYGDYKYTFKKEDVPVYDYETFQQKQNKSKYNKYEYKPERNETQRQTPSYQANEKIQNYGYDSNKMNQKYMNNIEEEDKFNHNRYKDQPRFGYKKDSLKQQKTYDEPRMRFDQDQEESSKFKSYKGIDSNFDTLGANPYLAYTGQSKTKIEHPPTYEHEKKYMQPFKLASSQVDQYTGPHQMQKKIKQNKYQKLGLEKQSEFNKKKINDPYMKAEIQESNYSKPMKSGAPIRDSHQHPKVLQYKGVVFHKIEVM